MFPGKWLWIPGYEIQNREIEHLNIKGGIFIIAKNDLILDWVSEMETNCELLWCKVSIQGMKQLLIGAYYHPKEDEADSFTELEVSLNVLWCRDDYVLPSCDNSKRMYIPNFAS